MLWGTKGQYWFKAILLKMRAPSQADIWRTFHIWRPQYLSFYFQLISNFWSTQLFCLHGVTREILLTFAPLFYYRPRPPRSWSSVSNAWNATSRGKFLSREPNISSWEETKKGRDRWFSTKSIVLHPKHKIKSLTIYVYFGAFQKPLKIQAKYCPRKTTNQNYQYMDLHKYSLVMAFKQFYRGKIGS